MPIDLTKKRRVMVNLDKALAMLVDEAAALERRSAASWLSITIEDKLRRLPDDQFKKLMVRLEAKLAGIVNPAEKKEIRLQLNQLEERWADLQYMDEA